MPTTVQAALARATRTFAEAGIETPALDARLLLQHTMRVPTEWLIAHGDDTLSAHDLSTFELLTARRAAHEPLAYITGEKAFWKDTFFVTPDTLIPRGDSETLIEAALAVFPDTAAPLRILDLGTGTGCLLLSLLREYQHATGTGIDIHAATRDVAARNAERLGLRARAQFHLGDMNDDATLPATPESFDLIISNPPYIRSTDMACLPRDVRDHEPHRALDGGDDGLNFYVNLFKWLPKRMQPSSVVMFEVGHDQALDITALAVRRGFSDTRTFHDLSSVARVVACRFYDDSIREQRHNGT